MAVSRLRKRKQVMHGFSLLLTGHLCRFIFTSRYWSKHARQSCYIKFLQATFRHTGQRKWLIQRRWLRSGCDTIQCAMHVTLATLWRFSFDSHIFTQARASSRLNKIPANNTSSYRTTEVTDATPVRLSGFAIMNDASARRWTLGPQQAMTKADT